MIEATEAVKALIEQGKLPVNLVEIDFAGLQEKRRYTTAPWDVSHGGHQWLSNGFLIDVDGYERVDELRAKDSAIGLSGVDLDTAAALLLQPQVNREVIIYDAWLNPSGGVVPDPIVRDIYFIDSASIEQGEETASVLITISGEFADFKIKRGIRTTDRSLRRYFPDDRLYQYSTDVKKELRWGGK